ncbi:hypothetical protein, partial [Herbaspirillum sp. B65]|uniref:hypothetical protein n=1 Tax=Herbaspirillum sp. B65 TaxID=137708 RepID=UPI001C251524
NRRWWRLSGRRQWWSSIEDLYRRKSMNKKPGEGPDFPDRTLSKQWGALAFVNSNYKQDSLRWAALLHLQSFSFLPFH